MDVSVVISTYNRSALLPATLRTVLAQTLTPREIIVVDDGSTDGTRDLLDPFLPRIRVISIANSGSIAARTVGLRAASSAFVAFCDSDDLWRPDFLWRMATLWRAEPRTKAAYANFQIVLADTWTSADKFAQAPAGFWTDLRIVADGAGVFDTPVVERLLRFQPFFPSTLVVPRQDFLDAGGWDEGVGRTVGNDFATALRLAERPPLGVVVTPLVGIRKHAGNFSGDTCRMNLGDADVLDYVLAARPSLRPYAEQIRKSAGRRRRDAFDSAFADGDFAAVRAIYPMLPKDVRTARVTVKHLLARLPPRCHGLLRRFDLQQRD